MPKTIRNFLVGIGYDYDKKGEAEAAAGLSVLRSRALLLGGALLAAGVSVNTIAKSFADKNDTLGKTARTLGVTAENLNAIGAAVRHEGGTIDSAISSLSSLEDLLAGFRAGDASVIGEAGKFGIDVTPILEASDAYEALLRTAEAFEGRTRRQQVQVGKLLGLDEATIRLLSQGRDLVEQIVEEEAKRRPIPQSYLDSARDYNDEMQNLWENLGRVKDVFGATFSDAIINKISSVNRVLEGNRDAVDSIASGLARSSEAATGMFDVLVKMQREFTRQAAAGFNERVVTPVREAVTALPRFLSELPPVNYSAYGTPTTGATALQQYFSVNQTTVGADLSGVFPGPPQPAELSVPQSAAGGPNGGTAGTQPGPSPQPRTLVNNFILDGKLLKQFVTRLLDDEVDAAAEDIRGGVSD